MSLSSLYRMPLSADQGWPEIAQRHPSFRRLFLTLVLPLSLVPPLMLYYAGTSHPEVFPPQIDVKPWGEVAVVFFLAEIATLGFMGWLVRQVAASHGLAIDYHDAYVVAAIAPVPMWLSALGLLVPNLAAVIIVALAGLALSCGLVYHGVEALARTREDVVAAGIAQVVIGAGLIAWVLLLLIALA
jgi:hypothetical protein